MTNKSDTIKVSYAQTGYFSTLVADYISGNDFLKGFYNYPVSIDGIKASIQARKEFNTDRTLLVAELTKQYSGLTLTAQQKQNLQALLSKESFTITTAHQPNIFTGPLYFIYKIMHVIKLADELKEQLPAYNFIPIYYMGSEDADLDELGYIHLNGDKLVWQTQQTGAVGRMKVDKDLLKLIDTIYGQIGIHPFGNELTDTFKSCFSLGKTIQQATLELVNIIFANYGILVLIPDNAALKRSFNTMIKKELTEQFSNKAVATTIEKLGTHYKVQAGGRALNLFYLLDDKRERIELVVSANQDKSFAVSTLDINWNLEGILEELDNHPERFSANVILRGIFQETILPNIAFIGGGGELAYWLELKDVFAAAGVPYPMLLVRNSFLLVKDSQLDKIKKLGFSIEDFFQKELALLNKWVITNSKQQLSIEKEAADIKQAYEQLKNAAKEIDITLVQHIDALLNSTLKKLLALEKKLIRAEKRKFAKEQLQIQSLKASLFPKNNLQERIENFTPYYAKEGKSWLEKIYTHSPALEQVFTIITG